jgi:hypothetical protein
VADGIPGGPGLPPSSLERLTVAGAYELERLKNIEAGLRADLDEAETKAWDSLARYKFFMFGYHAADVVKLRRRLGGATPNPFKALVDFAREQRRGS